MKVEPAHPSDLHSVCELLRADALPTEDLTGESLRRFHVVRNRDKVVGAVGLECHGNLALLRSLVVAPEFRGNGLGHELARAAEEQAQQLELSAVYLLTTTAAKFFAKRGFRAVARSEVPAAIQATREFTSLCPATAVVMVKP
jgi:amino-acid N-acetyltransferase